MSIQDLVLLVGALGAFFAMLGGGARWLLSHIEERTKEASDREAVARAALSERLHGEIMELRQEIIKVHLEKSLYLKRIYQLEYFIHLQPGINIPSTDGWPPE